MNHKESSIMQENQELKSSILGSKQLVNDIVSEVEHLSTEFRLGVTPELSLEFDECLSAIQTLMATMLTLQLVSKRDPLFEEAWKTSNSTWAKTENIFKNSLNAMLKAYAHEDYVGLADIMEEELIESLVAWKSFVEEIESKLNL